MKKSKILLAVMGAGIVIGTASGCAAKMFEEEFNVVFQLEGKIYETGLVTQFKNIQSPVIDESYIPTDYRFLGWTAYDNNELSADAETFKSQYIGAGRMVHYSDIKEHADNSNVTLRALILHKDIIPREYHYAVVAWYNKPATSGVNTDTMAGVQERLFAHLTAQGVTEENINTIDIRGYEGNVGPSTGEIMYDGDVDIMFGWGSNISTTGSIPEEDVAQVADIDVNYNGVIKARKIHLLKQDGVVRPEAQQVFDYLISDEMRSFLNPTNEGENA